MGMNTRAPKGGTIGMNGETYAGGTFLPTTTLAKMSTGSKRTGSGKQQIAPYVWEVAPEGMTSLYAKFHTMINWQRGEVIEQGCAYFGRDVAEVAQMFSDWKAGVRWIKA